MERLPLEVIPEIGVPLCPEAKYMDLRERAEAVCNTVDYLSNKDFGFDLIPTSEDEAIAAKLAFSYASDATVTSKEVTHKRVVELRPASLVLVNKILTEFSQQVVQSSVEIRNLITNKLLLEREPPDPRVRLKAIELLGKISDVGLFVEKSETVVTHQTSDDLKAKLRSKLSRLISPDEEITDAVVTIVSEDICDTVIEDA